MQNVFPGMSVSQGAIRSLGPALGEHNREVYGELPGFDETRIRELEAAGII